ncbi:MAG: glycosyltransferase family 2 protein [Candidatus Obscuribacterales bacterium]|nr:glycosyltransferase family 2 protein [Steroidobacteraceae bacterium]
MNTVTNPTQLLSIVVPVYNESAVLNAFHERLAATLNRLDLPAEVLYVNDGSTDETLAVLFSLREQDKRVGLINLSRNFGKELAMTAGFDRSSGDAVVVIDADLQDPPELISEFVREWRAGYDVVYGKRTSREGETVLKKVTAFLFYRLIQKVSRVKIPIDTGDFRLMSRRAVDALNKIREQHRFMKGLFAWIGYREKAVPYQRDQRFAGQSSFNYWKLWNFALEGVTSFTTAPLKFATYMGLVIAAGAFVYGTIIVYKTLVYGNPVAGYPSIMVVVLFLGGIQLVGLGIVGEYLGRMFDETKQRPLYLIQDYLEPESSVRAIRHEATSARVKITDMAPLVAGQKEV